MPTNDLHARVAAAILAQLETADPASWSPPWHGADPMPHNARTGRRYRGINVLALWCAAQAHGFADARWATYRQWAALGAQVRKAERGTLVLFYKELPRGAEADPSDSAPFVARAAHVFNAAQVEAAPPPADALRSGVAPDLMPTFDAFATATGAAIRHGGARACYVPATDAIYLPPRAAFRTSTGYAGTLAHELVHWTGAPHRLARDLTVRFGARAYAAEELVAEIGAAFILADLDIARTPHPDHAAYCASWAPLLRADPRALSTAATQASRAADHLAALQSAALYRTSSDAISPPGGDGRSHAGQCGGRFRPASGCGVSAVLPPPSRGVLVALLGEAPGITKADPSSDSTPVERALRDLLDALTTHEAALAALDRIAARGRRRAGPRPRAAIRRSCRC